MLTITNKPQYTLATKSTVAETGNEVDCRRYSQLFCQFWQQIGNNLISTACHGRHCCQLGWLCCQYSQLCRRYGRICRQCVWGKSDAVNYVDFQWSRPCWIQVCRQCVPGFSALKLLVRFGIRSGSHYLLFLLSKRRGVNLLVNTSNLQCTLPLSIYFCNSSVVYVSWQFNVIWTANWW